MMKRVESPTTNAVPCGSCCLCQPLTMEGLPNEVLCQILSELDVPSLCAAARVCQRWYTLIAENDSLWRLMCSSHCPGDKYVRKDRQLGLTWKATFIRNYGAVGIKRKWMEGEFSCVSSFSDLPKKPMCVMDAETWGEIFQQELER